MTAGIHESSLPLGAGVPRPATSARVMASMRRLLSLTTVPYCHGHNPCRLMSPSAGANESGSCRLATSLSQPSPVTPSAAARIASAASKSSNGLGGRYSKSESRSNILSTAATNASLPAASAWTRMSSSSRMSMYRLPPPLMSCRILPQPPFLSESLRADLRNGPRKHSWHTPSSKPSNTSTK